MKIEPLSNLLTREIYMKLQVHLVDRQINLGLMQNYNDYMGDTPQSWLVLMTTVTLNNTIIMLMRKKRHLKLLVPVLSESINVGKPGR